MLELAYDGVSNKYKMSMYDGSMWYEAKGSVTTTTGSWVHIVGTYDGSTIKLYRDNVLDGSLSYTGGVQYDTDGFYIGRRHDAGGAGSIYWNGKIGQTMIWNRALTSAEVTELYNGGAGKQL
jgi:hypothetical protein